MRIAPPSIFPAVVGKVVVAIVLERDSSTGAPKSVRTALWVIATPARALVAPRLLIPPPAVPPPRGETVKETSAHGNKLGVKEARDSQLRRRDRTPPLITR